MNYRRIARTILKNHPNIPPRLCRNSHQSDDERIAQVVWRRMQREMNLDQRSPNPSSLSA